MWLKLFMDFRNVVKDMIRDVKGFESRVNSDSVVKMCVVFNVLLLVFCVWMEKMVNVRMGVKIWVI